MSPHRSYRANRLLPRLRLPHLRAGACVAIAIALALPVLSAASVPALDLRLSPLAEGFNIHVGEEWPNGCLPRLSEIFISEGTIGAGPPGLMPVEPPFVEIYLVSEIGECEDEAARPWTLDLKLSPVVLPDHEFHEDRVTVGVWWQREDGSDLAQLAEKSAKIVRDCIPVDALCLQQGRFYVTATFGEGATPTPAHPLHTTGDSGAFWFFDRTNPELFVKVLDGCASFDRFWVFASGLTDVATEIRVLDRWTGQVWEHSTAQGVGFESVRDTDAFATCDGERPDVREGLDWSDFQLPVIGPGPEGSVVVKLGNLWRNGCTPRLNRIRVTGDEIDVRLLSSPDGCLASTFPWRAEAMIDGLAPGDYTVEVSNVLDQVVPGFPAAELLASEQVSVTWDQDDSLCSRSEVVCTADQRFATRAWFTTGGEEREARAVGLTSKGAGFWFFRPGNLEVTVKILDACQVFDRFWVFTSGLTDVGVRLEVLDRWTGETWDLVTQPGEGFPAVRDTAAFATCDATTN